MRLRYTLGIVLLAVLNVAFSQSQQQSAAPEPSQAGSLDVVANSVTNLAQKISLAIASPKSKTEIFSPVSIAGALSLLLLGSVGNTQTELMNLMGFKDADISFTDIHKSFGKLFRELVSNEPNLKANVPWRENDKCNNYDDDDEEPDTRGSHSKRDTSRFGAVKLTNGLFVQNGTPISEKYRTLAMFVYQTELHYLNFKNHPTKAVSFINEWMQRQSNDKISNIVSQLNADTLLVIANTLSFKAEWEEPFLKEGTSQRKFFPNGPNKPSLNVSMMVNSGCFPYYYWKEELVEVLGIPYRNNDTMYIFKPVNSDRQKLMSLHFKMNANVINDIIEKMVLKTAAIQFPTMHLSGSYSIKQILEQIGVYSVFDQKNRDLYRILEDNRRDVVDLPNEIFDLLEDTKANAIRDIQKAYPACTTPIEKEIQDRKTCERSNLCIFGGKTCICCPKTFGSRNRRKTTEGPTTLYINDVLHKVDVTITEKGTEGGLMTASLIDRNSPQVNFRANGPFVVMIRDESTKLPLFFGSVYDPTI